MVLKRKQLFCYLSRFLVKNPPPNHNKRPISRRKKKDKTIFMAYILESHKHMVEVILWKVRGGDVW